MTRAMCDAKLKATETNHYLLLQSSIFAQMTKLSQLLFFPSIHPVHLLENVYIQEP
jgi:hypothetical protein